jgi:hypothetical protein
MGKKKLFNEQQQYTNSGGKEIQGQFRITNK